MRAYRDTRASRLDRLPLILASLSALASIATLDEVRAAELPRCASARFDTAGRETYADYAARVNRKRCRKDWTILVYMAADNDLTPYAYWDLYEMEAGYKSAANYGASTRKTDLVVQLDTAGDHGIRRLHMFQIPEPYDATLTKEHFDRMDESGIRSPVVAQLPESREAEASKLRKFLEWGVREFPSDHVMVVVWGHGQGWTSARPERPATSRFLSPTEADLGVPAPPAASTESPFEGRAFGGLAFNQTSGSYLDIPSLRATLAGVSERLRGGKPFDVYASDACLMQMLEVATEMSGTARFVVGSTQVQNFLGLPYRRVLYELNKGSFAGERAATRSDDEPYLVARMMPKLFKASMAPNGLQGRIAPEGIKTVTMSALSSDELRQTLFPALDRVARRMKEYLAEDPLRAMDVKFVLQKAPTFLGGAQEVGSFLTLVRDLVRNESETTGNVTPGAQALDEAAGDAKQALHRAVMAYALGTNYTAAENSIYLMGFKAVSVWLPVSERDYAARIEDFSKSGFYRALPSWKDWLAALYARP